MLLDAGKWFGRLEAGCADITGFPYRCVVRGRWRRNRSRRDSATGWNVVSFVIASRLDFAPQTKATLHGFQQRADGFAVGRDLDLDALVAVAVDKGERLAAFVVDVLGDVKGTLMTFGAKGAAAVVHFVRVGASGTVAGVASEGFHHVQFVRAREA